MGLRLSPFTIFVVALRVVSAPSISVIRLGEEQEEVKWRIVLSIAGSRSGSRICMATANGGAMRATPFLVSIGDGSWLQTPGDMGPGKGFWEPDDGSIGSREPRWRQR
jgi:hypothetical protein